MKLHFTKMHGAGNDFIVIDAIAQDISQLTKDDWIFLANRQLGIGADQILLVESPTTTDADFRYRIINHDGSEVEQCGNGSRCFVRFVREKGLSSKKEIKVEVAHTTITLTEQEDQRVRVNMGAPIFEHNLIPFIPGNFDTRVIGPISEFLLPLTQSNVWIAPLSMGNPHAVQLVESVQTALVSQIGPEIESHPSFPKRVNVGFVEVVNRGHINIRVFERGSGETLSCGTGACAAAVTVILKNLVDSPVSVQTRGGLLEIDWQYAQLGLQANVIMTGPATTVFDGIIEI
ncbi:diaminopimelate epimerase [Polynucleobacter sp. SHI8]|uniref:diaminopimelate epimerase n=1 Tax=unclassified Polynucleobacter TaxID=2640945 RepID=UPI0024905B3F|nr:MULTISPECIES: diaminopimelate epimerase [unclassified Polynucleobacter]BDW12218.1 diaminopimelate epimerase [Polynucleobacter sp. SHI2]BDW14666.1 diaminopimelate epimerase [Polynucleobacter sp. SHI8]